MIHILSRAFLNLTNIPSGLVLVFLLMFIELPTTQALELPNFNNESAKVEWVRNSEQGDTQELNYLVGFKYGTPMALEQIFKRANQWILIKKLNYFLTLAAPMEERSVLVDQQPLTFKTINPNATYFIQSVSKPEVHLVVTTQTSVNLGEGGLFTKILFLQKNKSFASQLQKDISEELLTNSGYRGGALEFTKTGLLQFLPRVEGFNVTWEQLILDQGLKNQLIEGIDGFLKNYDYEKWKKLGLPLSQGVLVYGPPGTGKTFLGKILISNILNNRYPKAITYFHVQSRHIDTLDKIQNLYTMARKMSPSVVFFEDIDLIAGTNRNNRPEIKNELMQQLSGIEELYGVLTIGTTNVVDKIDPALKRSKRLGLHYNFALPSFQERTQLLQTFLKPYKQNNLNLEEISSWSEGFTGADLKQICLSAADLAINEMRAVRSNNPVITQDHLKKAMAIRKKTRLPQKK